MRYYRKDLAASAHAGRVIVEKQCYLEVRNNKFNHPYYFVVQASSSKITSQYRVRKSYALARIKDGSYVETIDNE